MHLKAFNPQKNAGFTLIELLIGLTLGLMVIASTLTLYVITTRSSSDLLHSTRLNHDLETIMQIMTHDIRRAGYQGFPLSAITKLTINNSDPSCITYSYHDGSGIRHYGFKRKGNSIALPQTTTAPVNCVTSSWEPITEENVTQITELTFSDAESQCFNATDPNQPTSKGACTIVDPAASPGDSITKISHITISLSGTLVQDATVTKRLDASVTVANPYTYVKP